MQPVLSPVHAELRRGVMALEAGDLALAEHVLASLAQAHPAVHEAWNLLSVVAVRSGLPKVAVDRAKQALALDRRNPVYCNNLGIAHGELGELADAEAAFRRALTLQPAYPQAMYNLGKVLHKQGRLPDSQRAYERAYGMAADLDGGNLRCNLAQIYQLQGRPDRALALLRESPSVPDEAFASTYASCLAEIEGTSAAISWSSAMLAGRPDWTNLRFERGVRYLGQGDWRNGWSDYAFRSGIPSAGRLDPRTAALPASLHQARVLVRAEQGLGDTLFFLRFVMPLRARGARVWLHCPSALLSLLRGGGAVDELIDQNSGFPPHLFDHVVWAGDLPALLNVNAPQPVLALRSDGDARARVEAKLKACGPGPYLGLTWRAGTDVVRGAEYGRRGNVLSKEVPLRPLVAAVSSWPGTLLALQRGVRGGEIDEAGAVAGRLVHDFSALNDDLTEMTAALDVVDEYVTVSNTNVHMRAGVGKRARVLVPCPAEWRWMDAGERSPWFRDMPIYRQPISRDWSEPLAALQRDLSP
jgi:Flp pilus assembly protein TadD